MILKIEEEVEKEEMEEQEVEEFVVDDEMILMKPLLSVNRKP